MDEKKVQEMIDNALQKRLGTDATKGQYGVSKIPYHLHNGTDAPRLNQSDIIPSTSATGVITMATDQQIYSLGLTFNPSIVEFQGLAVHRTTGVIDMRAQIIGSARLGSSYAFQAQSGNSVTAATSLENINQGCSTMLIDSTTSPQTVRVLTSEFNLAYVAYPTPVAVATITSYSKSALLVKASLASGWQISGNFIIY